MYQDPQHTFTAYAYVNGELVKFLVDTKHRHITPIEDGTKQAKAISNKQS